MGRKWMRVDGYVRRHERSAERVREIMQRWRNGAGSNPCHAGATEAAEPIERDCVAAPAQRAPTSIQCANRDAGHVPMNASVTCRLSAGRARPCARCATLAASTPSASRNGGGGTSAKNTRPQARLAISAHRHAPPTGIDATKTPRCRATSRRRGRNLSRPGTAGSISRWRRATFSRRRRTARPRSSPCNAVVDDWLPCIVVRHRIEIAGADLALMLDGGEALLGRRELRFLQLDERAHVVARIAVRQVEHRVVEAVEARPA